jgi:hypothetical protein
LEVVALVTNSGQAQHGELAGAEAPLELCELLGLELPVGDVCLGAVSLSQRACELAQAPDPVGEHQHLLL